MDAAISPTEISIKVPIDRREEIKALRGARWNASTKKWCFPSTTHAAEMLAAALPELTFPLEAAFRQSNYRPKPDLKVDLWSHQQQAFARAFPERASMLALEMRTGKTLVAIALAEAWECRRVLVMCPLSVVGVWGAEVERFSKLPWHVERLDKGSVKGKVKKLVEGMEFLARHRTPPPHLVVINHESVWREPFRTLALSTRWDAAIVDECFPTGTMILTQKGTRPIEEITVGEEVIGVDHRTGEPTNTTVSHCFQNDRAGDLTEVVGVSVTPDHPIWTREGYKPARDIGILDSVCNIEQSTPNGNLQLRLRMVREGERTEDSGREPVSVLQQKLFGEMENRPLRPDCNNGQDKSDLTRKHDQTSCSPRRTEETSRSSARTHEPAPQPSKQTQISYREYESRIRTAQRWQWASTFNSTETLTGPAQMGIGIRHPDRKTLGDRMAHVLQGRYRRSETNDRDRSGWAYTSNENSKKKRQKKRSIPEKSRLDIDAIQEQGNTRQLGNGCIENRGSRKVYNLETGTGNYVANGILVSNCHRAKAPGGKFSFFLRQLANSVPRRLMLTGTPMPHSPFDLYAQYRFLDRSIFGNSFSHFKTRYAIMGGFEGHEVKDWQNMEEFSDKFHQIATEVKAADAFDLPPELNTVRTASLEPKARKIYDSMEKLFWAKLEEGEITASNALVKLLRLQQITSGHTKDEAGEIVDVSKAKKALLRDVLQDFPTKQKLVIFVRFTHDLLAVREVCFDLGRTCGEISGQQKDLTDAGTFPEELDTLAVQIQSGSLGINLSDADVCIFYSWGWSLGDVEQARARIRHGEKKAKLLYITLTIDDTLDERMIQCLENRKDFIEDVIEMGRGKK